MIELVVFLHQIVCIVRYNGRIIVRTRLLDNRFKIGQHLNQTFFLRAQFQTYRNDFGNNDTCFGRLAQYRLDTGIRILNERSCIAIEIYRFFRIESHVLTCIHLQDKIFQSTQTNNAGNIISFFLGQAVQFS